MTETQRELMTKEADRKCPYCGSNEIEFLEGDSDYDEDIYWDRTDMWCNACERGFEEIDEFKLTHKYYIY